MAELAALFVTLDWLYLLVTTKRLVAPPRAHP
jgi:hypothetical protein